jgi:hypothetical protein
MRHHFNTRIGESKARTPQMWNGTQVQDATFPLKPQLGPRMRVSGVSIALWVFHGKGGDFGERNTENPK